MIFYDLCSKIAIGFALTLSYGLFLDCYLGFKFIETLLLHPVDELITLAVLAFAAFVYVFALVWALQKQTRLKLVISAPPLHGMHSGSS